LLLGYALGQWRQPIASDRKTPPESLANTDTKLFRVATRLFNHLFLDGTAQDHPLGKTLIDINSLQSWHAACAHFRNCASPSDIKNREET
jgi:hypothetical protein